MSKPLGVLIVEDSEDDALLLLRELRRRGFETVSRRVETPEAMKEALESRKWDIVISDYVLPRFSGLAALDVLKETGLDLPFIIVSGKIGEEIAVEAMRAGAHDYMMKGNLKRLAATVERELREAEVRRERRRAEETLRTYTARLELINRELREFAFAAAHDLKEPLRKIHTFADIIRSRHAGSLDDEARDLFWRMKKTADRMSSILEALHSYSQAATSTAPFIATDLTTLAEEAVSTYEDLIEQTGASIEIEDLPTAEVDPSQIVRLFRYLVGNALTYRGDSQPRVRIYCEKQEDNTSRIYVEDNGIGFDECYMGKIFAPFQRLHGRTGAYEGTGMGLAICRKIAERHGGCITAKSTPGEGSTFIVTIPLC